ncbi:MAG: hypothetical protein D6705_05980 [Deltaproteobacteria bacterium]|nr:MAG: hypothetical protein D6705_05980 [Deltaproteobacteria bacterium]
MPRPPGARILATALSVCLVVAAPAGAAEPKVTPATMAGTRGTVQQAAKVELDAGNPATAADRLSTAARQLGDPVLFIDAAEAFYAQAEAERTTAPLDQADEHARIALDILYFLQGPMASKDWQPVDPMEIPGLVSRANDVLQRSQALRAEIEAEAAAPKTDEKKKGAAGPKVFIATGAALTALGAAGLGVGVAGLAIGAVQQDKADDPTIYGDAYDAVERKGKVGNALAYAGLIAGGLLAATGIALLVVGKKRAGKSDDRKARLRVLPAGAGIALSGRF